jgi:hypothetical protein
MKFSTLVFLANAVILRGSHCPCVPSSDLSSSPGTFPDSSFPTQLLLCIENTIAAHSLFYSLSPEKLNLNYRLIPEILKKGEKNSTKSALPENCSVVISIIENDSQHERCPGVCKKIPSITLPLKFLKPSPQQNSSTYIRCSLNLTISHPLNSGATFLADALKAIATRKLHECREIIKQFKYSWDYNSTAAFRSKDDYGMIINGVQKIPSETPSIAKRPVYGVVLWVASVSRLSVAENQLRSLSFQQKPRDGDDSKRIFGWIATEEVYPCMVGSNICSDKIVTKMGQSQYRETMPFTILDKKSTLPGWACAQRRPLRALAHVLHLYDPDFVLVVDDDTFVNAHFLSYMSPLGTYIMTVLRRENVVLGELNKYDKKVTKGGFYFGGSGYLMGRGVLSQLTSHTIASRRYSKSDWYRSRTQTTNLGILSEALQNTNASCTACIRAGEPIKQDANEGFDGEVFVTRIARLSVRVIDLCTNMMADTATCYHSDHSLTRCLAHGTYSDTKNAGCESHFNLTAGGNIYPMAMCYEGATCDLTTALTCHRYVSFVRNNTIVPESTLRRSPMTSVPTKASRLKPS